MPAESDVTIAIVDDDQDLCCIIERFLQERGYQVWSADSSGKFYKGLIVMPTDLVLVDINLPGENGFDLIEHLAATGRYSLIAMSGMHAAEDRVKGLNCGADMFFVKPVSLCELEAGIRAVLRRKAKPDQDHGEADADAWQLDYRSSCLHSPEGGSIRLTSRELALLSHLMSHPGKTVYKKDIHTTLNHPPVVDFHRVESMLYRLRKKVEDELRVNLPIHSVFGRGMVFSGAAIIRNRLATG